MYQVDQQIFIGGFYMPINVGQNVHIAEGIFQCSLKANVQRYINRTKTVIKLDLLGNEPVFNR